MDLDLLKKGKERETYTDYINQLIKDVKQLHNDLINDDIFNGEIFMIGDQNMILKCHPYLKLNIIFEKQPYQTEIAFEKKHINLTNIKLRNDEAIKFIKKIIHNEIVIVEYHRILTTILPSLFVKILPKDKYEKVKNKYLNRKSIKIYTGSKIIQ